MKKYILIICLSLLFTNSKTSVGQTPQLNLDKYWHYRWRLTHYFMKMGSKEGMSIPADSRNGTDDPRPTADLSWVDGGRLLGWYMMMLATEYRLLKDNGQNTDENVEEMYYAIHAVFRIDSVYMDHWVHTYHAAVSPFTTSAATWPGEGIMPSDDINYPNSYFYSSFNLTSPINAGLKPLTGTPAYTSGAFGPTVVVAEHEDGKVGPVVGQSQGWGPSNTIVSQDNYLGVLMGLETIIKIDPDMPIGFPGCSNPYGYNKSPYTMAKELGKELINYIANVSNWCLVDPLLIPQACGPTSDTWFDVFSIPIFIISPFFNASCVPPGDGIPLWSTYVPQVANPFPTCGGIQQLEMGIECAAMSNDGGAYSSACDNIQAFGNNVLAGGCIFGCYSDQGYLTAGTGWDIFYGALNEVLWQNNNCGINICDMEGMVNSAPFEGPFCHVGTYNTNDCITESSPDFALSGWGSSRRFMMDYRRDFNGNWGGAGNYNGLDYMVLYNLFRILGEKSNPPQVKSDYPYFDNFYQGFALVPSNVNYPCSDVHIDQLDIHNTSTSPDHIAGGLKVKVGKTNEILFKPLPQTSIIVESGGYLDASCPLICNGIACSDPNGQDYYYEPDPYSPTNGADQSPVKPKGDNDNNPPYQKSPEFDTAYTNNALGAYPNPFSTQTAIDFSLPSNGPISIYITSTSGARVATLVDGEAYSSGGHVITYNGTNLAAGTYLCTLVTSTSKKTIRIVKTK